jgi:hypothetical protein
MFSACLYGEKVKKALDIITVYPIFIFIPGRIEFKKSTYAALSLSERGCSVGLY